MDNFNATPGYTIRVYIKDKEVGGQQSVNLAMTNKLVEVTNKIDGSWSRFIPGNKGWAITCSGFVIQDEESFKILEEAFDKSELVKIRLTGDQPKEGYGYITSFPVTINYRTGAQYAIQFTGSGELGSILD